MKIDEAKLNTVIKSGETKNLFLLYGKEIFLTQTYTDKILSKYSCDKKDTFNFVKFEGCPDIDSISDSIEALPVFSDYKVIVLNDFDIEKYDIEKAELLADILTDIPVSSIVLLTYTGITPDLRKAKTKKIFSAVDKNGIIAEFDYLSPQKISGMIIKKAARQGIRISDENARCIAELTLCDLTLISGEVDKLCSYVGSGGEITRSDIELMVSKQLATSVFELTSAIASNNIKKAFDILHELFDAGYAEVVILAALSGTFLDYYAVKLGMIAGKTANNIAEDFVYPKNRAWIIDKTIRGIKNIDLSYIKKCLNILSDADHALKSSPVNNHIILERTITKLAVLKW